MTIQELINKYQLAFVNKQLQYPPDLYYSITKWPETLHDLLTEFLYIWNSSFELDKIIAKLEDVLNGVVEKGESGAHHTYVDITLTETDFYAEESTVPDLTIPTQDFHDILILWRNFLNEAPLDGSMVEDRTE